MSPTSAIETPVSAAGSSAMPRARRRSLAGPAPEIPRAPGRIRTGLCWMLGVAVLGMAWLVPETGWSAALGWVAALLMAYALRSGRGYLAAYVAGAIGHVIGFHWVYGTVAVFGGFGAPASAGVFAMFVGTGALQFLAIAVIDRHLDRSLDAVGLRSATAVVLAELLMPRLFPWHFGHTQIAFTPFVLAAGIGGAMAVSFLMFWLAEVAVRAAAFGERRRAFLIPVAISAASIAYGLATMERLGTPNGDRQEVIVVQGPGEDRRDVAAAQRYAARLFELGRRAAHPGSLIVWPEGAVPVYLPARIGWVCDPPRLPWTGDGTAYLVGAYSYLPDERKFNAAFAVYPGGEVPMPYFKRVLIPFGEYMPLASWIPWIGRMNQHAGVFSAGTEARVFEYPMQRPDGSAYPLKVAPLICYEDTVPALAREATRRGAELLVNISSDAWFGRSLAPRQHHLIAAFRAIENRRFLVRSTTTGDSAIVDPLGRTIARIPPFSEGVAMASVGLLKEATPYAAWVGDRPWWGLLAVCVGMAVARRRSTRWRAAGGALVVS